MSIDKFHTVVGVLQKTSHVIEKAIPNFAARSVVAEPPALTGVLLHELHLRLLLQMVDRDPMVSFTIQVKKTRIDGYFGGRPIFLWAGDGQGFEDSIYIKDVLSKPQETHVRSNMIHWYSTIEEICRFASGNTAKPVARLVDHERTTHSTLQRFDTLPALPAMRQPKVA